MGSRVLRVEPVLDPVTVQPEYTPKISPRDSKIADSLEVFDLVESLIILCSFCMKSG